jgi:hypothetical protein
MKLKELIKKRIEENVAHYDIGVIESYEYLIEMIAIEYHTQQSSITAVVQAKPEVCDHCEDPKDFYLGMTCEHCKRPFRSSK